MEVHTTTGPGGAAALGVGRNAAGGPLWTYVWGASRRPFVHPLTTPAGVVLTVDAPDDHPWHHGLWFTIKFVDGDNFWEEYDAYGVLRHREAPHVDTGAPTADEAVTLTGALDWIRPDRRTVAIEERRSFTHRALGPDAYALDVAVELTPTEASVLDRTPFTTWGGYGGLTIRGAPSLVDTELVLDGERTDRCLGERGRNLVLVGTDVGTGRRAGFAIADHPANGAEPVCWYASTRADTYGGDWANFVNAALLWDGPLTVPAGAALGLSYRVVAFDGVPAPAELDRWLATPWSAVSS